MHHMLIASVLLLIVIFRTGNCKSACTDIRRLNIWLIIEMSGNTEDAYYEIVSDICLYLASENKIFPNLVDVQAVSVTTWLGGKTAHHSSQSPCSSRLCIIQTITAHKNKWGGERGKKSVQLMPIFKTLLNSGPVGGDKTAKLMNEYVNPNHETLCVAFVNSLDSIKGEIDQSGLENMKCFFILFPPAIGPPSQKQVMPKDYSKFWKGHLDVTHIMYNRSKEDYNDLLEKPFEDFTEQMCKTLTKCQYVVKEGPCIRYKPGETCIKTQTIEKILKNGADCPKNGLISCQMSENCSDNFMIPKPTGVPQAQWTRRTKITKKPTTKYREALTVAGLQNTPEGLKTTKWIYLGLGIIAFVIAAIGAVMVLIWTLRKKRGLGYQWTKGNKSSSRRMGDSARGSKNLRMKDSSRSCKRPRASSSATAGERASSSKVTIT